MSSLISLMMLSSYQNGNPDKGISKSRFCENSYITPRLISSWSEADPSSDKYPRVLTHELAQAVMNVH